MALEDKREEKSAQMNSVSAATEERKGVPMDQIPPTTVPVTEHVTEDVTEHVTEPVSVQPRGCVGRRPVQDYVGKCRARIEELARLINRAQDPAERKKLSAQLQAAKQRMNKSIRESKEQEHFEIILCFIPADKRVAARKTFFDFINVSDDDFKDIFEK